MPLNINQVQMLRIGSLLEQNLNNSTALQIYHRVYEMNPQTRESENALFRTGNIYSKAFNDPARASATYYELIPPDFPLNRFGDTDESKRANQSG